MLYSSACKQRWHKGRCCIPCMDNHRHMSFCSGMLQRLSGNSITAVASTCTVHWNSSNHAQQTLYHQPLLLAVVRWNYSHLRSSAVQDVRSCGILHSVQVAWLGLLPPLCSCCAATSSPAKGRTARTQLQDTPVPQSCCQQAGAPSQNTTLELQTLTHSMCKSSIVVSVYTHRRAPCVLQGPNCCFSASCHSCPPAWQHTQIFQKILS